MDMPDLGRLPANAPEAKKRMAAFLKQRLKVPDVALIILFSIRPWAWALLVAWLIGSSLAAKFEVRLHKGICCLNGCCGRDSEALQKVMLSSPGSTCTRDV